MDEHSSTHKQNAAPHERASSLNSQSDDQQSGNVVRTIVLLVIALVLIGGGSFAIWHYPFVSDGSAQAAASPKKGRASAGDQSANPFIRHATERGVDACKDTYAALGEALAAGSNYMVQTETANSDPNKHSMQGLVGLNYARQGDYSGPAAGLVFASPAATGKGCEGTMVRVVPFQQSCQAAANLLPQGSRQGQPLSGVHTFALPNGGHAMLLPSGASCVVLSVVRGAG